MSVRDPGKRRHPDSNPVNLLLLVPIVLSLAVPFYNSTQPTLWDIPFFYWFQMLVIPIGVVCTVIVYRTTKDERR